MLLVMLSFRVSHDAYTNHLLQMSLKLVSLLTVVGEGLSPPRSLLRVNPSPTSSRSRSLRSSAPKVSSWVCRSDEGLFDVELVTLSDNKGSSFKPFGDGKPPDIGGSPPKIFPSTYLSYFRISDIFAGNWSHHWIPPDLTRSFFSRRAHLGNDEDICNNTAFYCEDILNENQHSHYYEQIQNKARIRYVFFLPEFPLTFDMWIFVAARHQRSI